MDTVDKKTRSKIMSKIRSKNTKPELLVRKYIFSKGYRYRIHNKNLPGNPDISIKKYKIAIFINGCFWHGHDCDIGHLPKSNADFWREKIEKNRKRDLQKETELLDLQYSVYTIWECELTKNKIESTLSKLIDFLTEKMK